MKTPLTYEVPLITQGMQECLQASAAQLLSYYGVAKTVGDLKREVSVYISPEGKPVGTSIGHMASYFITLGFETTIHTTDIQIFDRSWQNKTTEELISLLKERQPYLTHPVYDKQAVAVIFDGYLSFLQQGGKIVFPLIDGDYIYSQLQAGPLLAIVSYTFFNSVAKYAYDPSGQEYVQNPVTGNPSTHAVVIHGYKEGSFNIADPDKDFGGYRTVSESLLIASLYLAQTDLDNCLITLRK